MTSRTFVTSLACLVTLLMTSQRVAGQATGRTGPSSISFISITTDHLDSSLKFYTQVLGGMQATELSFRFHGDDHYELMFQRELEEARGHNLHPLTLGVPDIRTQGTHEVRGEFVVFDNGLLQLIQFVPRDDVATPTAGHAFSAHETRTSPAYIAAPHVCFWVQDDVEFNEYIAQLENRSAELGLTNVKANRPVEVHSESEREAVPTNSLGITFNTGDFAGLSFAYFKGPRGEQLELYRLRNETRHNFGRDLCKRGGVATAYVSDYHDNQWKRDAGLTGKLFGLMQFGTRTEDLWRSVDFYVNVLGAHLVEKPLQATNVRGDDVQNMLFQKEMMDAESLHVPYQHIGVANISDSGPMRLDHRFSLFDNYVVETLLYTDGLTLGDQVFEPRYNHSSLAYLNDMSVALSLPPHLPLQEYLPHLASNPALDPRVKLHRLPAQGRNQSEGQGQGYAVTFTEGALSGLSYATLSGTSGEHVSLVQWSGAARGKLRRALLQYGAVSTEFPETDARATGRMDQFCQQFPAQELVG